MKIIRNPNITYLAKTNFRKQRKPFGILESDRFFHTYILGKTGVGKSNLLLVKIFQDIKNGKGVYVCDVHGDLIKTIAKHIPSYRRKDVIYLNIPDPNLTLGYNPLKRVSYEKRSLAVSGIMESLQKLFTTGGGVRMEHLLRHILLTLADQPQANFRDVVRIIHDLDYRKKCFANIINPDIKNFWLKEFPSYGKNDLAVLLNKIGVFLAHPKIKRLLVENKDSLSFRKAMDNKKIILVNLSKGELGTDVCNVLGSMLISTLTSAAFSRIDIPENNRVAFHIYLDEFQNYTNKSLIEMLSELRKFRVSMTLAHQYGLQLNPEIRNAVLGNVGTIITFRLGTYDAREMLLQHVKDFQPLTISDYVSQKNQNFYIQLMLRGKPSKVFSAETFHFREIL